MAMLNTVHDIPTCSSVDNDSRDSQLNRFWALESTPVLRTKLHTKDREFSCPENGGGYWNRPSMGNRVSDTMWDYPIDKVGEQGNCTNKLHLSDLVNRLHQIAAADEIVIHATNQHSRFKMSHPLLFERGTRYSGINYARV